MSKAQLQDQGEETEDGAVYSVSCGGSTVSVRVRDRAPGHPGEEGVGGWGGAEGDQVRRG